MDGCRGQMYTCTISDAIVYPEFVSYYLLTDAVKMKDKQFRSRINYGIIEYRYFGDIDIILPDCEEQKRIALILGTIDKK